VKLVQFLSGVAGALLFGDRFLFLDVDAHGLLDADERIATP